MQHQALFIKSTFSGGQLITTAFINEILWCAGYAYRRRLWDAKGRLLWLAAEWLLLCEYSANAFKI